jgi:predicted RecA/RadA family phage recombinase
MGDTVGIAASDMDTGESGTVFVEGVYSVAKATGTAWGVGDKVDWDASASAFDINVTPASGDVTGCAMAAAPAAADATTGLVKLTPGTGSAA